MATAESRRLSRREAIKGTAAVAGAALVLPRHILGGGAHAAPSARLNVAGIGIGGVAHGFLRQCAKEMHIRALCDVDDAYAGKVFQEWPDARRFRDYRELFDTLGGEIDAVLVGTPDHTHAVIVLEALRRGKHTCCVKPLTRTVAECRAVVEAAHKAGVATQVTARPNTNEEACRTCELIWEGAIGDVREVHVWSNRPLWPQGMARPEGSDPVPETLDWDLWLGPAQARPFKAAWPEGSYPLAQINRVGRPDRTGVYHPWNFRGWWDFGTGALGDMGCHHFNTPFRALKLGHPVAVEATATRVSEESFPLASIVTLDFPKREGMPPLRLVWYDGGLKPPRPKAFGDERLPQDGELYIGDKGVMFKDRILDQNRARRFRDVPKTLERRDGTFPEWFEAIAGGPPAGCDFAWAGLTTEAALLGNIAIKHGRPLAWDGKKRRFTNDDAANTLLAAPYRDGWTL